MKIVLDFSAYLLICSYRIMVESFSSFRLYVYFMWNVQLKLKIIKIYIELLNSESTRNAALGSM